MGCTWALVPKTRPALASFLLRAVESKLFLSNLGSGAIQMFRMRYLLPVLICKTFYQCSAVFCSVSLLEASGNRLLILCASKAITNRVTKMSVWNSGYRAQCPLFVSVLPYLPVPPLRHLRPLPVENGTEVSVEKGNLAAVLTAGRALWLGYVFGSVCVLCFNVCETSGPSEMREPGKRGSG